METLLHITVLALTSIAIYKAYRLGYEKCKYELKYKEQDIDEI